MSYIAKNLLIAKTKQWVLGELGMIPPRAELRIRQEDTFLVSYPKSGNTWLRFLIASLLYGSADFPFIESKVPDIYQRKNLFFWIMKNPRYIKSHEPYTSAYRNVVYIYRDPVAVCFSYYRHILKVKNLDQFNYPVEEHIEKFLLGKIDRFGPWDKHVDKWLDRGRKNNRFIAVKYEDLLAKTESLLSDVTKQLELVTGPERISHSVKLASRDRMQALEENQGAQWKPMRNSSSRYRFVGDGRADSIETKWADAVVDEVKARWGDTVEFAGYQYT